MRVGAARRADSRNVVAPYAGRIGAGALAPLLGANGDGLRSVSALVGPNAVGNVFSGLGGDGISIFGAAPRDGARARRLRHAHTCAAGTGSTTTVSFCDARGLC
jgi:hypothetical protein